MNSAHRNLLNQGSNNTRRRSVANQYHRLNLSEWSEKKCLSMTRFTQAQIKQICTIIGMDLILKFNDFQVARELALAMVMTRLSFPRRLIDMAEIFGMSEENVSRVVNGMSNLLFEAFKTGIEFDKRQFSKANCERFSEALFDKGAYFPNVVGFIDGTMQQTCRPTNTIIQRELYNGWKHIHCLKYQAVSTPDGITSSICGPFNGSNNDQGMFNSSEILGRLISHFETVSPEKVYAIYGDEAYSIQKHVYSPFPKATMTPVEELCNKSMAKVRVAVEMEFGKTAQFFSGSKWKYGNRILQTKPALKYILASIFKNFHTCIHGSAVSRLFDLSPPNLEEYIRGLMRERDDADLLV